MPSGYEYLIGPVINIDTGVEFEERFRVSWMIVGPEVVGDQYEFTIDSPQASINDDFYTHLEYGSYWGCVELEWLNADGEWEVMAMDYIEFDVIDRHDALTRSQQLSFSPNDKPLNQTATVPTLKRNPPGIADDETR